MTALVRILHGSFGRVALLQMTGSLVPHAHPQRHLLFNLSAAPSHFSVAGTSVPLTEEYAVAVNRWEPHRYPHCLAGRRPTILALYTEAAWLGQHGLALHFADRTVPVRPVLARLCAHLRAELLWPDALSAERAEAAVADLVRLAAGPAGAAEQPAVVPDARIRNAIEQMRRQRGERVGLAEIAAACGMSRPHFFELFRRSTGLSPLLYRSAIRMEQALAALSGSERSIGDIGCDVGFAEQASFTRFFRTHQGMAPREYRRAVRQTIG